ncbi:hypothetical protein [Dyadobacter crusticola]|uniref:hypothetical protein n=1 Tax=Dyadobacter crusticola TaxID=292407 RepID=UPI0004E1237A|nr:hypothetical protein [Dyadobacter crusticola]
METTERPLPERRDSLDENASLPPTENELAEYVARVETEENIQKLARKLSQEWNEENETAHKPDLSYARFEEKRRSASDQ